jgi:hypothetical protein
MSRYKVLLKNKGIMDVDGQDILDISDGYHTFSELYAHRCTLFILLALSNPEHAYWRDGHDGWPLVGIMTPYGQISYHVPENMLHLFKDKIKQGGPEWDKHTSGDVLDRMLTWAKAAGTNKEMKP